MVTCNRTCTPSSHYAPPNSFISPLRLPQIPPDSLQIPSRFPPDSLQIPPDSLEILSSSSSHFPLSTSTFSTQHPQKSLSWAFLCLRASAKQHLQLAASAARLIDPAQRLNAARFQDIHHSIAINISGSLSINKKFSFVRPPSKLFQLSSRRGVIPIPAPTQLTSFELLCPQPHSVKLGCHR
ncbi:hypothetical protein BDZ91DRAFT_229607 [Kalaharituber pfeilii]|nr:hypothetical protein BDZ91DRAFT_229607 [Kalaharituber pfeilii]